ncbi:ATP-binding protein [Streptomyces lichenis]|uniref:ATP-binding protein n=1 Tax=Streptomyces lichenis TaxID=2306967 RepID=A0ABT0IGP1_9ACTN|nr:ATP-binding protein [Streptomyces lichenis]MCK8680488.1 ATP-binding protein [Streptomyces lichenis]
MTGSCSLTDSMTYTPDRRSVRRARRRVAALVIEWGHPGAAGDAALIAGELAANALLHGRVAGRMFRVEVSLDAKVLRVAVTDARGERLPEQREAGVEEQCGRGLAIVDALAARWGVERLVVGKRVWAELDVDAAAKDVAVHSAVGQG